MRMHTLILAAFTAALFDGCAASSRFERSVTMVVRADSTTVPQLVRLARSVADRFDLPNPRGSETLPVQMTFTQFVGPQYLFAITDSQAGTLVNVSFGFRLSPHGQYGHAEFRPLRFFTDSLRKLFGDDIVGIDTSGLSPPNPFSPSSILSMTVERAQRVRISVTDTHGAEIAVLADSVFEKGMHHINIAGVPESGAYIVTVVSQDTTYSTRFNILR